MDSGTDRGELLLMWPVNRNILLPRLVLTDEL